MRAVLVLSDGGRRRTCGRPTAARVHPALCRRGGRLLPDSADARALRQGRSRGLRLAGAVPLALRADRADVLRGAVVLRSRAMSQGLDASRDPGHAGRDGLRPRQPQRPGQSADQPAELHRGPEQPQPAALSQFPVAVQRRVVVQGAPDVGHDDPGRRAGGVPRVLCAGDRSGAGIRRRGPAAARGVRVPQFPRGSSTGASGP